MDAFGRLLESQIPRLRRYARALTRNAAKADDLVQTSLVRALEKQHSWQPGTDLRTWLFTLLHNQHVNDVRRAVRHGSVASIEDAEAVSTSEPVAESTVALRDLERAIALLPEEQQATLLLIGLEGMQYEQAASILGVPVGTVRSRLSRARSTLHLLMEGRRPIWNRWGARHNALAA
jgi:RNA polymerase sigma-70 factor, ECF subfamily